LFLTHHLSAVGSYTDDASWPKVAKVIAKSIRAAPVVKDHPDWWVRLHMDGLVSHQKLAEVNQMFFDLKILLVIENSHSSHVNQAFDADPAKEAKKATKEGLSALRDNFNHIMSGPMDQWALLKCCVAIDPNIEGIHWVRGFKRVNLHPEYELPIDLWIIKIRDHIEAASHIIEKGKALDQVLLLSHAAVLFARTHGSRSLSR
jgi:hypothetical protein